MISSPLATRPGTSHPSADSGESHTGALQPWDGRPRCGTAGPSLFRVCPLPTLCPAPRRVTIASHLKDHSLQTPLPAAPRSSHPGTIFHTVAESTFETCKSYHVTPCSTLGQGLQLSLKEKSKLLTGASGPLVALSPPCSFPTPSDHPGPLTAPHLPSLCEEVLRGCGQKHRLEPGGQGLTCT